MSKNITDLVVDLVLCGFNSATCLKPILKLGKSTGKDNTENKISFVLFFINSGT